MITIKPKMMKSYHAMKFQVNHTLIQSGCMRTIKLYLTIVISEDDIMAYGKKDGSQTGRKSGGIGRNQTPTCRNPATTKKR